MLLLRREIVIVNLIQGVDLVERVVHGVVQLPLDLDVADISEMVAEVPRFVC